jgi:hypothetical protein
MTTTAQTTTPVVVNRQRTMLAIRTGRFVNSVIMSVAGCTRRPNVSFEPPCDRGS